MTAYTITWRNPRSGEVERMRVKADTPLDLELSLAFWRNLGYEIVSVREVPSP